MSLRNSFSLLSFISIVVFMTTQTIAQPDFLYHFCQDHIVGNNYSTKTYQANLNHLLSTIPSSNSTNINHSGFYNSSYGQNSDQVRAIGLCRGDVKPEACRSCLNYSTNSILKSCPNQKEATGWYAKCMLRYSNRSIFGVLEADPTNWLWYANYNVTSNVDAFNQMRMTLFRDLRNKAAAGGSLRKFATGNETAPNAQTIYALVQCTPDLSQTDCTSCLDIAMGLIPICCDGLQSAIVISPSCNC